MNEWGSEWKDPKAGISIIIYDLFFGWCASRAEKQLPREFAVPIPTLKVPPSAHIFTHFSQVPGRIIPMLAGHWTESKDLGF